MPRSVQDILDHADEFADRFEDYDPSPGDRRTVVSVPLDFAALLDPVAVQAAIEHAQGLSALMRTRVSIEVAIVEAVQAARRRHESWSSIGRDLGTSGEAARQKYGTLVRLDGGSAGSGESS